MINNFYDFWKQYDAAGRTKEQIALDAWDACVNNYPSNQVQAVVMKKIAEDSGIPEYDELAKLWNEGKLDPTSLASRMWNKGYNAGCESTESNFST